MDRKWLQCGQASVIGLTLLTQYHARADWSADLKDSLDKEDKVLDRAYKAWSFSGRSLDQAMQAKQRNLDLPKARLHLFTRSENSVRIAETSGVNQFDKPESNGLMHNNGLNTWPVEPAHLENTTQEQLKITLRTPAETEQFGVALARNAQRGDVLFLEGHLGAGKTSVARGFIRSFFRDRTLDVPSPSYLLHFSYAGEKQAMTANDKQEAEGDATMKEDVGNATGMAFHVVSQSRVPGCVVHHVDPYRLQAGKIAALVDLQSAFANDISLIEWPCRLGRQLVNESSPDRLEIEISGEGVQGLGRQVVLKGVGLSWQKRLKEWGASCSDWWKKRDDDFMDKGVLNAPAASNVLKVPVQSESVREKIPANRSQWLILGIESSCDDTGAAVINGDGGILGQSLASQAGVHEEWGGVVPILAQEAHKSAINETVELALQRSNLKPSDLTAVAATVGPGLSLCLSVGVKKALQIAAQHRLPFIPIHHMEAHAMVAKLPKLTGNRNQTAECQLTFPFLTVLVSGGHNLVVLSNGLGNHTILGRSLDDSIGEAFDKSARVLGIQKIPGGPELEALAAKGNPKVFLTQLPRIFLNSKDKMRRQGCDFSFSGLKTSVRMLAEKELSINRTQSMEEREIEEVRANIAAGFQEVAVRHLEQRVNRAVETTLQAHPEVKTLVLAGGVAANKKVRGAVMSIAKNYNLELAVPPPQLCVDNGVMIAWCGLLRFAMDLWEDPPLSTESADLFVEIRPRWPLGEMDMEHCARWQRSKKSRAFK
eukprot:gnl/MRDRNA2_/MRDRNA2_194646_c0_seq1.p1 gnl/MRDRNA2_/MRDRNA2_194646_c0~~gnl/MRDRNA2_/MRDRNA2_194646_c0_seq1.p1  ORF type:complete len:768 (+),score=144.26 gnl/MRDRNA2_/MRDRNA2_194646_c0_seq1:158-2461(+)